MKLTYLFIISLPLVLSCDTTIPNRKRIVSKQILIADIFKKALQDDGQTEVVLFKVENRQSTMSKMKVQPGDYQAPVRDIKAKVKESLVCTVQIDEVITYVSTEDLHFIDHTILHNNADIQIIDVTSKEVAINAFVFNKKHNKISVFFDKSDKNEQFNISFSYRCNNLIKNTTDSKRTLNQLVWKFMNDNYLEETQNVTFELIVDTTYNLLSRPPEINPPLEQIFDQKDLKMSVLRYKGEFKLENKEVQIIDIKLPFIFNTCSFIKLNYLAVISCVLFVLFLVSVLYVLVSLVLFEKL